MFTGPAHATKMLENKNKIATITTTPITLVPPRRKSAARAAPGSDAV